MYLWVLDEQPLPEGRMLDDSPIVARLALARPDDLARRIAETTSMDIVGVAPDAVTVVTYPGATMTGDPESRHTEPSFVIDYDEAAVRALAVDMGAGESPTPEALRRFVFAHVSETRYARAFDLASRVAATREGDCTEHAVLLTALARAAGYPARVVFGVLLMEVGGKVQTFGHAWAEIYVDNSWQLVDSTLGNDVPDAWMRYVPLLELTEEGPGYGMTLLSLTTVLPSQVRVAFETEWEPERIEP